LAMLRAAHCCEGVEIEGCNSALELNSSATLVLAARSPKCKTIGAPDNTFRMAPRKLAPQFIAM